MEEEKKFGKATVGVGTRCEREIDILGFLNADYKNHRLITILELDNHEGYIISVENPESTGRSTKSNIWLSKESFIGVLATSHLFFTAKGEDFTNLLKEAVSGDKIDYTFSDNLKAEFIQEQIKDQPEPPQSHEKSEYPFVPIEMGGRTFHTHNMEAFHPDKIEPPKQLNNEIS